jgi:hypothetical protein
VAAVMAAPGRAGVIGAHRGADPSAAGGTGPVGFGAIAEARFRAAEPLGVPARGVVAQVVVDVSCVAPIAPVGRRATVPSRDRVAIPNVKVISFAAHASSLVARRSPLAGMRPLPEGRARRTREPAEHKRYLLETVFTGWSVLPLGYRPGLLAGLTDRDTGPGYRLGLRTGWLWLHGLALLASFTGWSAPAASGVRLARQCRERKR